MAGADIYDLELEWESRDEGNDDLLRAVPTELLEVDEELYRQGNAPVEFSIVRHGQVEVAKQAEDGSKSILEILGAGEPVGALAVINDFPYPATVRALEETVVYRFAADLLPELQDETPSWLTDCIGTAAKRIADLAERLESINTKDVGDRLSQQLCKLAEEYGQVAGDELVIDTKITRQMLADLVGCRVESAIRKMSEWEKKGIIQTQESRITLKQPQKIYSQADQEFPETFKG